MEKCRNCGNDKCTCSSGTADIIGDIFDTFTDNRYGDGEDDDDGDSFTDLFD